MKQICQLPKAAPFGAAFGDENNNVKKQPRHCNPEAIFSKKLKSPFGHPPGKTFA